MEQGKRRFRVVDLIFLVATFAIVFAVCLTAQRYWNDRDVRWSTGNTITFAWFCIGKLLFFVTVYLAAMILRRRPSREALVRSRGSMGVLAIALVAALHLPTNWSAFFNPDASVMFLLTMLPFSLAGSPMVAAGAAMSVWCALHLASVPASESDWLDRAGKAITVVWFLAALVQPALNAHVFAAIGISF